MERRITDPRVLAIAALWLCLGGTAEAGTVRGAVQFPDEVKGGALRHGGYWRVPNGVLPVAPPLHDVRADAVVVLVPEGEGGGAEARPKARAEIHLSGLRMVPPVSVVAPGATVTLQNDDRLEHALLCPSGALPRQSVPAGGKVSLSLPKAGEYVLGSEELPHLAGAVLVLERALVARVEPGGTFSLEAPQGRYAARVFWRGAYGPSESLQVPESGVELRLKAAAPAPKGADGKPRAGQSS